jgi:hypothetical protein
MKKWMFLILLLANSYSFCAVQNPKTNTNRQPPTLKKDTIYVLTQKSEEIDGFDIQKNMPWIGAVLVGFLAVFGSVQVNKQLRKSNKEITNLQLAQSKELLLKQLEFANKSVQLEFNKTVLSGNRQVWINDLRENISKIISNVFAISLKQCITNQELENLRFLIIKVELMLNRQSDVNFITSLTELEECCLEILMSNKTVSDLKPYIDSVKFHAQVTLKTEWERVKKGE